MSGRRHLQRSVDKHGDAARSGNFQQLRGAPVPVHGQHGVLAGSHQFACGQIQRLRIGQPAWLPRSGPGATYSAVLRATKSVPSPIELAR